jgi:hypothetical protein
MTRERQDELHKEFRTLVMLLQLVTYRDHGSSTLLSDTNGNTWHQVTFRSRKTVLDATADLLVRNHEKVAVTAGNASPPKSSNAAGGNSGQVLSLFAMQDAPYMGFTGVPLNKFAAPDNRAPCEIFSSGKLDGKDILLIHGQSAWMTIFKNSWHGLSMG